MPNPPAACSALTLAQDTCFTGAVAKTLSTDLAGCCTAAASSGAIFNHFDDNSTCNLLAAYVGTVSCDGVIGYKASTTTSELAAPPAYTTTFVRTLARASPSLMWAFPRAGTEPNIT